MAERGERLTFTKMQGVGNDFVVIDAREREGRNWSGLAPEICDRRFGIGADGLLIIETSRMADIAMRMYNPDGTPDVCGNGLRCVARFVLDHPRPAESSPRAALTIATLAGVRRAGQAGPDESGEPLITVDMGRPQFAPAEIPALAPGDEVRDYPLEVDGETIPVTALSTGTTHTIIFVPEFPDEERFFRLSPLIEHHPLYPERTSIMWTRVEGPGRLRLRIWERGAGETWGCGTGSCAAAVAARRSGHVDGTVTVASKGGELRIDWEEDAPIRMTGPARYVFEGVYPLDSAGRAC